MLRVTKREALLIFTPGLVIVGLLGAQMMRSPRDNALRSSCSVRLAELGRAMSLYAQNHDGFYPQVFGGTQGARGWADNLSRQQTLPFNLFVCYGNKHRPINPGIDPSKTGFTDYWMNGHLSGKAKAQVASPTSTLLLGEGNDGTDVSDGAYSKTTLSWAWLDASNSPASRHEGGANYLMVDGTVHWLRPEQVTHFGGRKDAFALK